MDLVIFLAASGTVAAQCYEGQLQSWMLRDLRPNWLVILQFGKQIQAEQVPGWSSYYLDYKFLKKIISSLAAKRPASEAAALALGIRPADILNPSGSTPAITVSPQDIPTTISTPSDPEQPPILSSLRQDGDRGVDFQAHKAAFFFKLERELEKVRGFSISRDDL